MSPQATPTQKRGEVYFWRRIISAINRSIEPKQLRYDVPTIEQRRADLLAWILFTLIFLILAALILVLIVDPLTNPRSIKYIGFILVLLLLIILTFILNRRGHYFPAAVMTVLCAAAGPWGSMLIDPTILRGDLVPLAYMSVSVLLASLLLSSSFTILLAIAQFAGLIAVFIFNPFSVSVNWPSLMALFLFISILSVLSGAIGRLNQNRIDRQTQQLIRSEALLRELSVRDYLTNLFNRRYLEETLEREIQRAARKKSTVGVIMIDIDHFKEYNDTLGHANGDSLILELGKLLAGQVRYADIACRYGGDEFVLVMPEAPLSIVEKRAESLRLKTKQIQLEGNIDNAAPITISQGIAMYPDHGVNCAAILKAADGALYCAKKEGRDHVTVAKTNQ